MEGLKRIIGPAPSEMTREELIVKIRRRQEVVGALLQRFREQSMTLASSPRAKQSKAKGKKGTVDKVALGDLMRELKEAGISLEEFKRMARGREG